MRTAARLLLEGGITRRAFVSRLARTGMASAAAARFGRALASAAQPPGDVGGRVLTDLTGGEVMAECLMDWGVEYVFGLGGSEEVGFLDALVDRVRLQYVQALHETSVVAIADGYARASGQVGFVNVHAVAGTAYALGQIVNAFHDRVPLVITAGEQSSSLRGQHAFLEGNNLAQLPRDYAKWCWDVLGPDTIADVLRRAFLFARIPPGGPAFVTVSKDFWERKVARAEVLPSSRWQPDTVFEPDASSVKRAADLLLAARFPVIVSGADVGRDGGADELVQIAELIGSPVFSDLFATHTPITFPTAHPHYAGFFAEDPAFATGLDVFWSVGGRMFGVQAPTPPLVPRAARVIHTTLDAAEIGRTYPADVPMVADVRSSAAAVLAELRRRSPGGTAIEDRTRAVRGYTQARRSRLEQAAKDAWDAAPIANERLSVEIDRRVDAGAILVCELISEEQLANAYFDLNGRPRGRRQFITSGGCLGWGVPAAIGAKIADPDRQVVALVGDGSFLFGAQALWTAARYEVPVLVVIWNNRAYQANRRYLDQYGGRAAKTGKYIGCSLAPPDVDHVAICRGYGVDAERVDDPSRLPEAIDRGLRATADGRAYVLDVRIRRRLGGAQSTWYDFFSIARRIRRQT
jgi:thiamine pyrophosphate-dependent acetolactate synthase large subunit-like protein